MEPTTCPREITDYDAEMEQKEGQLSEDGAPVSPTGKDPRTQGVETPAEKTKGTTGKSVNEGHPDETGTQEKGEAGISAELQGEANGLDEVKVESQREAGGKEDGEAELTGEDGKKKEEPTGASQQMTDRKEETKSEPKEAEGKEEGTLASEKPKADGKEAKAESGEEAKADDKDKPEPQVAGGEDEAEMASQEESQKTEEPMAKPQEKTAHQEAKTESEKAAMKDEAQAEAQEAGGEEEAKSDAKEGVVSGAGERKREAPQQSYGEPGSPSEEQGQDVEKESEGGAEVTPSSPEEWPESPTEEGHGLSPDELGPDSTASGQTGPSASESSPSDAPQSPPEPPPTEKKKEKAPERRVSAPARPRGPRAQNRKAIMDKFGGAASGPTALFRNTKAAGAAIGGVKNMLLEWCRAMTRNYEHVDIQNFSSSWSSGMAFCALIHKFFPDAFDYAELDPTKRRHNFTLAFSTAEKLADCAQLLEVDDMVRLAVPDSKCVYTYIQELYRSLVQKGLVKTKKK
ncbi:smoothelin-like protein 1 [Otolemur garnettii]|uniref:smoothelin-like protein 1 n=1 Tax=Otolemur garnettii TaxID=30611 RepID=UPI00064464EB|nr:smoothelin-like protein 1 [Otolemur garnettii]